ncbi:hypothetical protein F5Y13DRAFT_86930 [Hypoxylon sp. FL1857]|nr:hypothetical protein F5Y13DRAFT_86930 [Hypoxylon sp. FL1857]
MRNLWHPAADISWLGRWFVVISVLIYITFYEDDNTAALVSGGQFGLIFVADTANVGRQGHRAQCPGTTETVALQIPTHDGKVPGHNVLHMGPCIASDIVCVYESPMAEMNLDHANPKIESYADNLLPFRLH